MDQSNWCCTPLVYIQVPFRPTVYWSPNYIASFFTFHLTQPLSQDLCHMAQFLHLRLSDDLDGPVIQHSGPQQTRTSTMHVALLVRLLYGSTQNRFLEAKSKAASTSCRNDEYQSSLRWPKFWRFEMTIMAYQISLQHHHPTLGMYLGLCVTHNYLAQVHRHIPPCVRTKQTQYAGTQDLL
jgi:hypothetical protein